ncbi:3'-5' exonuclease, partial [Planctomycetota bacterium]
SELVVGLYVAGKALGGTTTDHGSGVTGTHRSSCERTPPVVKQDTTNIQYDLVKCAFHGSHSILTAVGDTKQRIMVWAGALKGVFRRFKSDFDAKVFRPANNYRAAPRLVRILHHLSLALDPHSVRPTPTDDGADGEGECRVLVFSDHRDEANHLASLVEHWIDRDGVQPRDICVLTRNRPADYGHYLVEALSNRGICARVENELQDLLAEPIATAILDLLKLACRRRAPEAWSATVDLLLDLRGETADRSGLRVERQVQHHVAMLRLLLPSLSHDRGGTSTAVTRIVDFLGRAALVASHPQYRQGTYLDDQISGFVSHMSNCRRSATWDEAIDALEGVDSVPVMTMHKSKGLEYHTVVFVGLEDDALWGWRKGEREELCGFFVAFSRAEKRVIFTFSRRRPKRPGDTPSRQSRSTICKLYELLEEAGVEIEDMNATT